MPKCTRIRIVGGAPLRGAADLPPDLPIAHRALVFAALGDGDSRIEARLEGAQLNATIGALRALGVRIDLDADATRITGRGIGGLSMAGGALDCGHSPTTLALLAGLLAGQRFGTRLLLANTPRALVLEHLVGALRSRGAQIAASGSAAEPARPPLAIAPLLHDEQLRGIECALPEADVYAKSAVLISGLFANGPTAVSEPLLSADHTERMLTALGVPVRRFGSIVGFDPAQWSGRLPALGQLRLPGSSVAAAYAAAAASVIAGGHIALRDASFNPTSSGFFDALRLLGARLAVIAKGDRAGREPTAELQIKSHGLRGGVLGGEVVFRCGESLPALCLLGTRATRGLRIADGEAYAPAGAAAWLELAAVVRAFGVECTVEGAGLILAPAAKLRPAQIDAHEDHRLALTAVVFGLAAEGETLLDNANCLRDDTPGVLDLLRQLGARIDVQELSTSEPAEPAREGA